MVEAHRKRGALIALDDLSGGTDALPASSSCAPTSRKIDRALTAGHPALRRPAASSSPRSSSSRTSRAAKVVAEGIERVDEFETMLELGVDLGQGFYFGQPTERRWPSIRRLVGPCA